MNSRMSGRPVWIQGRRVYVKPGWLPEKEGLKPLAHTGMGVPPVLYVKRRANGTEVICDYDGNPYKAPRVLGF